MATGNARMWVALTFCGLIAMMDGADSQSIAIAAPIIVRELAIRPDSMGLVFSMSLLGAAIGAFTGGLLADRFGVRRLLACSAIFFGLWQLATGCTQTWSALLLCRVMAGFGLGAAIPCFLGLAAANVSPERRARTLGIIAAFYPVGGLVGGIGNGWLVEHRPWNDVFVVGGVLPIVIAILLLFLVPEVRLDRIEQPTSERSLVAVLKCDGTLLRGAILLCCISAGIYASVLATVIWMPTLLAQNGLAPGSGGAALAWHSAGSLVTFMLGGWLFERFGRITLLIGLIGGTASTFGLSSALTSLWMSAVFMLLHGAFLSLAAAAAIAVASELFPPDIRTGGLGMTMASGRGGQMVPPYLMGIGLAAGLSGMSVMQAGAVLPAFAAASALLLHRLLARNEVKLPRRNGATAG